MSKKLVENTQNQGNNEFPFIESFEKLVEFSKSLSDPRTVKIRYICQTCQKENVSYVSALLKRKEFLCNPCIVKADPDIPNEPVEIKEFGELDKYKSLGCHKTKYIKMKFKCDECQKETLRSMESLVRVKKLACLSCTTKIKPKLEEDSIEIESLDDLEPYKIYGYTQLGKLKVNFHCKDCGKTTRMYATTLLKHQRLTCKSCINISSMGDNSKYKEIIDIKNIDDLEPYKNTGIQKQGHIKVNFNCSCCQKQSSLLLVSILKHDKLICKCCSISENKQNKTKEEIELMVQRIKNTKKENYGNENFVNIEKAKKTKLEKYGNENYVNVEKYKETISKRTKEENNKIIEKRKQTNLKKYGYEHSLQVPAIYEKCKKLVKNYLVLKMYHNLQKFKKRKNLQI